MSQKKLTVVGKCGEMFVFKLLSNGEIIILRALKTQLLNFPSLTLPPRSPPMSGCVQVESYVLSSSMDIYSFYWYRVETYGRMNHRNLESR